MKDLTFEDVSKLVRADFATGKLYWLPRPREMFASKQAANAWNTKYSGKEAFTALNCGYRHGTIFNIKYTTHRVIWLLHTGNWPTDEVDHINGDKADNRIENLRSVGHAENGKNRRLQCNNSSRANGVSWDRRRSKWRAYIKVDGKARYLGRFLSFDDAVSARKAAEEDFGFHPNHGRAA